MRFLPLLPVLALALASRVFAQNPDPITYPNPISTQSVSTSAGATIDLRGNFAVPSITGQLVQFTIPGAGTFNVAMDSVNAPSTVANFLAYVNANRFVNTLVHRSNPGYHIIQGGGYVPNTEGTTFTSYKTVLKNSALAMEGSNTLTHGRGTIAMARTSASLDTATSEWFINTSDNTGIFKPASDLDGDNTGSDSYAVFGRVVGTGMSVVDAIAALPVITTFASPFNELPVFHDLPGGGSINLNELVKATNITAVPQFPASQGSPAFASFTVTSSDPSLVAASVSGSYLFLGAAKNLTGSATVSVTATDSNGNAITGGPFTVNVTRKVMSFNADTVADLIFQNGAGQIITWYLDSNAATTGSAFITPALLGDWKIAATGDINGDGNPDLIFQNTYGQVAVWFLDASGGVTGSGFITPYGLGDWRVVAAADISHDGIADLIFQNSAGQIVAWLLNSSGSVIGSGFLSTAILGDWRVKCAADVNSDSNPDIIFQNSYGQAVVWYMDANFNFTGSAFISPNIIGDWRIASATDIDGDGYTDLLLQNNYGQIVVWKLNSAGTVLSSAFLYGGGLGDWRLR